MTDYYVSHVDGNDSYNGEYPTYISGIDGPWATFGHATGESFSAGDTCSFRRGGTYEVNSTLWWSQDGSDGNPIVFDAYDTGDKPIWNALDDVIGVPGDWTEETGIGSDIWSRSLSGSSKRVFVGDYESAMASVPANINSSKYLWNISGGKLYVYSTQNPANEYSQVLVMTVSTLFAFNDSEYTTIQNIRLQGGRCISINNTCSYLKFLNNDIWYWGEFAIFSYCGAGDAQDYIDVEYNDIDAKRNLIDKAITETENRGCEDALRMYNAQNNWNIRYNTFQDGGHCLILMYDQLASESGIHNNLVEYNEFYGDKSTYVRALGIQGNDGDVTNNTFRYNWIEKMNVRSQLGGNGNKYNYNIFYDTQDSPVTDKSNISQALNFPGFGTTVSHDNDFHNNVIYKAYNVGIWFVDSGNDPDNISVKNNIVMETGDAGSNYPNTCLLYDASIVETSTIEYNCFYDGGSTTVIYYKGTARTVEWCNDNLTEFANNLENVDPKFVDPNNGNFHLQSDSPCRNAGVDVGLTEDYEGTIVPQESIVDIGAFEYYGGIEMPYSTDGKNAMLDALGGLAVFASLHEGDPGDTGINEISGGSPAYARKAITWSAASGGILDSSNQPVFDVGAGKTVSYVGFWSAVTAGVFYGAADVTDEVFAGQGTYTLTDADLDLNA